MKEKGGRQENTSLRRMDLFRLPIEGRASGLTIRGKQNIKESQKIQETNERDFALAKKITFWYMAQALRNDVTGGITSTPEFKPLSRKGVKGHGKGISIDLAPLAHIVAKDELAALGLTAFIELEIAPDKDSKSLANDANTDKYIVTGYRWKQIPQGINNAELEEKLNKVINESDESKDQLIAHYQGLVVNKTKKYSHLNIPLNELSQIFREEITKKAFLFDWRKGFTFRTFAHLSIEGIIKHYLRDSYCLIRPPTKLRAALGEIELALENGIVTIADIQTETQLPKELITDVLVYKAQAQNPQSLYEKFSSDDHDSNILDIPVADFTNEIIDTINLRTILSKPDHPIFRNNAQQKIIISSFLENKSQTQIAAEIGISQMSVSRLLTEGLLRLRAYLDPEWAEGKEDIQRIIYRKKPLNKSNRHKSP